MQPLLMRCYPEARQGHYSDGAEVGITNCWLHHESVLGRSEWIFGVLYHRWIAMHRLSAH